MNLLETLISGGPLIWPIGLCSVVALGIVIERFWSLSRARVLPETTLQAALNHLAGNTGSTGNTGKENAPLGESELAQVLQPGLEAAGQGPDAMRERIEEALEVATLRLERWLNWLASIASVTPLLGLLGTVLGMIEVFAALMQSQTPDLTPLAGGISEALISTAAGLGVAIPSLLFVAHFDRRVLALRMELESAARALLRQREVLGT